MDVIRLVQGDTKPSIILALTDETTGLPINLAAASTNVYIKFRAAGSTTLLSTITCQKFTNGSDGKVQFDFSGGVLNVSPGMYEGEIEVDFNGEKQTVYDTMRFRVRQEF